MLSIELAHKNLIDGVRYDMEVRFFQRTGLCPVPENEPPSVVRDALLNTGSFAREFAVPVGACAVYKVDIIDLATSDVISTDSVSIDNI